ncbi:hypothetical protein AXM42_18445 [Salmonella enterica subsp. enterica]|nr:hypothetical protein [Salmonella enterica subsp. enterica]EAW1698159.1 hypothetical protein [Salmonella enterica subsp. enterica]EAW1811726.1 hypothetical protein [Salmonella enterica subsp. enterica]EDK8480235.1 hypothetical protein [Salmonella enterica subsp. enterica serovar Chailey]
MRIVDRKAFLSLPQNTVYSISHWTPEGGSTSITDLLIKGPTVADADYYETAIPDFDFNSAEEMSEEIERSIKRGWSVDPDFSVETRNSMFDENQMYAVWEKEDIERLIERLKECL